MTRASSASRWVAAAIGVAAGVASGLLGVGGGFLIVPLLITWTKTSPIRASGTSLAAILPIALAGAAAYYYGRMPGEVDLRLALFLVIGSTGGAYIGARFVHLVPDRVLKMAVVAILVIVACDEIVSGFIPGVLLVSKHTAPTTMQATQYALIVATGLCIGAVSGIIGVGGGIFLVPALVMGFGFSHHLAQGTSLVAILPTAAVGALTHYRQGHVDLRTAAWIGVAGMPLAMAGAALALSLPQSGLAVLFGLLLLFAARQVWPGGKPSTPAGNGRGSAVGVAGSDMNRPQANE